MIEYTLLYLFLFYLNFQCIVWYGNLIKHNSLSYSSNETYTLEVLRKKLFTIWGLALLLPIVEIIIVKNFEVLFPIAILLVAYPIVYAILKPGIDKDKNYWSKHTKNS